MFNETLEIDDKDQVIMSILQANPDASQLEIAKSVGLSQPSVGMRVLKLKRKGIISTSVGMNFRKVKLFLAKVDVQSNDTEKVIKSFDRCPFFLNGMIVSGADNLCMFFMSPDMVVLEGVINYHLRQHPNIQNVKMEIVISPIKDFIFPVSLCEPNIKGKKEFKERCTHCPFRKALYSEKEI